MIRLMIVDDHTVVRQSMRFLLAQEPDIDVAGEAATGADALSMARAVQPDVMLLDLLLPDIDGIAVLERVRRDSPDTRAVMLTSAPDDASLTSAIRAGATSYVQKTAEVAEAIATVRAAARRETALPPDVATRLLNAMRNEGRNADPLDRLTQRERDVLRVLAQGQSNREIARTLRISEETVKTHMSSILTKTRLDRPTQAAIFALRHRLVDMPQTDIEPC